MAIKGGPVCVSVINMKGGVGKTTIAAMLARFATSLPPFGLGKTTIDTLAVDLDPQANLSQALMGRGYEQFIDDKSPSIVEIFQRRQSIVSGNQSANLLDVDEVVRRLGPNLQLIPSKFHFSDNLIGAIGTDDRILARLIADNFQDRDLIIIDCPPTESIFTRVAYHASRFILVPVKPEFFATIGFPLLNDSLSEFKRKNPNHDIEVIGIVINDTFDYQADDYTPEKSRALKEIKKEAECSGWYIFENGLEYSRGFPKIMRGDYDWPGDAPRIVSDFAEEFIEIMWDIVEPEFIE